MLLIAPPTVLMLSSVLFDLPSHVAALVPGVTESSAGTGVLVLGLGWVFFVVRYTGGAMPEKHGVTCPRCKHSLVHGSSFEIAIATGNCGGCGTVLIKDE